MDSRRDAPVARHPLGAEDLDREAQSTNVLCSRDCLYSNRVPLAPEPKYDH